MDVAMVVRRRLKELGLEQRDLALSAQVTESYISQLLNGKKTSPAPHRTEMYEKMESFLRLPSGELSRLAALQRIEELKRNLADPPTPLLKEVRELILRKCIPDKQKQVRAIFEMQPMGELERLVTEKLLDVVKRVARQGLESEGWLQTATQLSDLSYENMRVTILNFLDTDIFNLSAESYTSFLDPMIESWDINFDTFGMVIVLNHRVAPEPVRRLEFVETGPEPSLDKEPGLIEFLHDSQLSGDTTKEEIAFLERLRFETKRPTTLYYYRELQNLRDPLHFA